MKSYVKTIAALLLAMAFCSAAIAEPKKTGDDDDIDDLIIERAESATADKARRSAGGSGVNETEDDLYVGSKPQAAVPPDAAAPANALSPASGTWGEFVTVSGTGYGRADGVQVRLYPNDDDSQPATMRQTATLYSRNGADTIQIQIPQNPAKSGWTGDFTDGVVRVYVYMPGQLEPVLAGRYTVGNPSSRAALRDRLGKNPALATQPAQPDSNAASDHPASGPSGLTPGSTLNAEINPAPDSVSPPAIATTAPGGDFDRFAKTPGSELQDSPLEIRDAGQPVPLVNDIAPNSPTELRLQIFQQAAPADKAADPAFKHVAWEIHVSRVGTNTSSVLHRRLIAGPGDRLDGPQALEVVAGHLLPEFEYDVWVTSEYADGTRKPGHVIRLRMPEAVNPDGFTAAPFGTNSARLTWTPVPGATQYLLNGSGLTNVKVTDAQMTVPNLGPGNYEWSLIAVYGEEGVYNDLNPSTASLSIAGAAGASVGNATGSSRSRYRVSISGFRVDEATSDDPLQIDGKGDEIYIAVAAGLYSLPGGELRRRETVSVSPVFGDKNGFETTSRVLAGGASQGGGLRTGDVYPSPDPVASGRTATRIDLPYLVWEGELVAGEDALVITPVIWEWDNNPAKMFQPWSTNWRSNALPGSLNEGGLKEALNGPRLSGVMVKNLAVGFKSVTKGYFSHFEDLDGDRPISSVQCEQADDFAWYNCLNQIWVPLSKELIDRELSASDGVLPAGVMALRFDDDTAFLDLAGTYTLYLKVERLP